MAVRHGIEGHQLVEFAELVVAFIDELSAASVAGHTDELAVLRGMPVALTTCAGRVTYRSGALEIM